MTEPDLTEVPAQGTILAGKYEVMGVLGKGGMGVVIEARHLRLNQNVALKLLLPSVRGMGDTVIRFEREARAAARLQSPHVVRILDVDLLPNGCPFMVMERLRGHELEAEITARGPLPIQEAVGYILQACAAMAVAHRAGIVHRDLKPSNLFLSELEGQRTVLKVFDFGISKLAGDVATSVTATTSAFGTPLYMSPEQVRSVKHVDARTDIWSLGVILYEMLAGTPPFQEPSATALLVAIATEPPVPLQKLRPEVPVPLANAVMRALEKDPDVRFADVREFAAAIRPFGPSSDDPAMAAVSAELAAMSGEPARAPSSPSLKKGKRRAVAVALAVAAAAILGVIFVATRPSDSPVEAAPEVAITAPPIITSAPVVMPGTALPLSEPVPSAHSVVALTGKPAPPPKPSIAPTSKPESEPQTPPSQKPPPPKPEIDPKYL